MASAAYSAKVRVPGTSTAFTNEATTKLTANTVYQVTDATKRAFDPSVALTVEVDADGAGAGGYVTASPSTYTVNYLFGIITFASDQGASALVRVSGSYLPMLDAAEVVSHSFEATRTELDKTSYDSSGHRQRLGGLLDVSAEFKTLASPDLDLDAGAGTVKLNTLLTNGTPVMLEVERASKKFRAWVQPQSVEESAEVDGLVETSCKYTGAAQAAGAGFAWEP